MKKRLLCIIVIVSLLICSLPVSAFAEQQNDIENDIVILYENDVHCEVEGYSVLSAMRNELQQEYEHVGIVTSGDFLQGGSLGSISRGEYIVRLMNLVGYDAIALGNHEFDYGLDRLYELADLLNTKPVCANFKKIGEGACFEPYTIVSYGDVKIAYIGITTPTTPDKTSFPTEFLDENKNPLYTFSKDNLADVVQESIDEVLTEGADYVIALSHLGDKELQYNAAEIVSDTVGLDAVLDAHSHSVIESEILIDKNGNEVVYTSTGTKFSNIGKLTITEDSITTELISLDGYQATNPAIDDCIKQIKTEYAEVGNKKVADCDFDLITHDAAGNRLVRVRETNLGNLISDAFRHMLDTDIAYFNGGGIRSHIESGTITFNDLLAVLPFNNTGVAVEVSGQTILEMLETAVEKWPEENGNFPHVSGLTFSVNTLGDAHKRVYNVKVMNDETGNYEVLDLDSLYTVASNNFILLECGDGMTMFAGAKVVRDTGILDVEILENYIVNHLGGVIGEAYAEADCRIAFTEGEVMPHSDVTAFDAKTYVIWIAAVVVVLVVLYRKIQHKD
ncbi:MAG: bifunctional metallophosphatase/5'-nucleotidase [Peptococcaceae bacterium]|nr:bifunctional metallophosphatase/5'-nucleotidase [Peptococcaceae bacterium]